MLATFSIPGDDHLERADDGSDDRSGTATSTISSGVWLRSSVVLADMQIEKRPVCEAEPAEWHAGLSVTGMSSSFSSREPARLEFSCIGCVGRMEMADCHVHGVSIAAARQVHAFRPQLKLRLPVPWAP